MFTSYLYKLVRMAYKILNQLLLGIQQSIRSDAKHFPLNTFLCVQSKLAETRSREELRINNLDQTIRVVMQPRNRSLTLNSEQCTSKADITFQILVNHDYNRACLV
jgi:hypothetical protein